MRNKNSGEYEYDDGVNEFDNFAFNSTLDTGNLLSSFGYAKNEKKAADNNTQTYVLKQTQVELQYSQTDDRLFGLSLLRENTAGSSLSNGEKRLDCHLRRTILEYKSSQHSRSAQVVAIR